MNPTPSPAAHETGPTPRVDATIEAVYRLTPNYEGKPIAQNRPVVTADFARTLERELAECREALELANERIEAKQKAYEECADLYTNAMQALRAVEATMQNRNQYLPVKTKELVRRALNPAPKEKE